MSFRSRFEPFFYCFFRLCTNKLADYFSILELVDNDNLAISSLELPTTQQFFDTPAFYDHYNGLDRFWLGYSMSPDDSGFHDVRMQINSATVIPEPATLSIIAVGAILARRRKKKLRFKNSIHLSH